MSFNVSMILNLVERVTAPAAKASAALKGIAKAADGTKTSAGDAADKIDRLAKSTAGAKASPINRLGAALKKIVAIVRKPSDLIVRTKADPAALKSWKESTWKGLKSLTIGLGVGLAGAAGLATTAVSGLLGKVLAVGKESDPKFARKLAALGTKATAAWDGFFIKIGKAGLFDVLGAQFDRLGSWIDAIAANGKLNEWANNIGTFMKNAGAKIAAVDWAGAVKDIIDIGRAIADFARAVAALGGGGLRGLFNIIIVGVIAKIAFALYGLATALGVVSVAGAPIWLVVAVIAAVAAGAFLVYRNWDKISAWFAEKWAATVAIFTKAGQNIVDSISGMWTRAKSAFATGVATIWNMLPAWMRGIFNGATFGIRVAGNLLNGQSLGDATSNAAVASGLVRPQAQVARPQAARPSPALGQKTGAMNLEQKLRIELTSAPGVSANVTPVQTAPNTKLTIARSRRGAAMSVAA